MPYRAAVTDVIFQKSYVVKCNQCSLLQIDKKFSSAIIEQYYKNTYDRDDIYHFSIENFPLDNTWSLSRGRALAKLLTRMDLIKQLNPTVMDLGCGYGHLLYGFSHYLYNRYKIIGVDYEQKTKDVFIKYNWTFERGGIDNVYEKYTGMVDVLITSHVFEHVIDPHDFLNKCSAMLSKDGILLWEIPNLNEFNLACEPRHSPHICLWDIHSLKEILISNNFEILFLETAGKKYTWFDKKKPFNIVINKIYKKISKSKDDTFEFSNKESIGYQLDLYGPDRRNLRLVARRSS
jgi:2-polyprenyl-3-methyl-5-hydroxy-6-metoxy-1,4-benzoquinol methylase